MVFTVYVVGCDDLWSSQLVLSDHVSQHTRYVMWSAHYQLPEMPTVRSTSPTDIPRWISICLCDIDTRQSTSRLRCRPSDPEVLQTFHGGSAFAYVTSALGKVPAAWDADRPIRKSYRHSTVDQHSLMWQQHSAQYPLPETSPIRSLSLRWIRIHMKMGHTWAT